MTAFLNSGRSSITNFADLKGCFRPEAGVQNRNSANLERTCARPGGARQQFVNSDSQSRTDLTEPERNSPVRCHGPRPDIRKVVADFRVCLLSCACLFQAELYVARFVRGATH